MSDRRCPIDETTLVEIDYRGIIVDQCPSCRGIYCDVGELQEIVERVARPLAALRRQQDRLTPISVSNPAMTARAETPRFCPVDGAELSHIALFGIAIDVCPLCQGIWLDAGKLELIISLAAGHLASQTDGSDIETMAIPFSDLPTPRMQVMDDQQMDHQQQAADRNFIEMLSERSRLRAKGVYELDMPTSTPRTVRRQLANHQAGLQLSRKTQQHKILTKENLVSGYKALDTVDTGSDLIEAVELIIDVWSQ
ncbi:MAG: zf-TFIIB domain-containing protein [Pseudomonadota bacterium]